MSLLPLGLAIDLYNTVAEVLYSKPGSLEQPFRVDANIDLGSLYSRYTPLCDEDLTVKFEFLIDSISRIA